MINPFTLSIICRCFPYLQANSAGNSIPLMGSLQRIHLVPSEDKIFEQKPHPTNLSNPLAFLNLENRPSLPSNEKFFNAESIIGEFLKTSYADPQPTVEVEENTSSIFLEDSSPPLPTSEPSYLPFLAYKLFDPQHAIEASTTKSLNVHVKKNSKKNYASLPTKILLGAPKVKDPQAGGFGGKCSNQEPSQKKPSLSETTASAVQSSEYPLSIIFICFRI